jgi:hypothetical protein
MRHAVLAPTFATEANRMKVLGTVRRRLNTAKVMNIRQTPARLREAPILSTDWRALRCSTVRFMKSLLLGAGVS